MILVALLTLAFQIEGYSYKKKYLIIYILTIFLHSKIIIF